MMSTGQRSEQGKRVAGRPGMTAARQIGNAVKQLTRALLCSGQQKIGAESVRANPNRWALGCVHPAIAGLWPCSVKWPRHSFTKRLRPPQFSPIIEQTAVLRWCAM